MNARMLGLAIAAGTFFYASGPVMCASTVQPVPVQAGSFAVERGQVAALVATGLPFQMRTTTGPIADEAGLGVSTYSDARLKTDVHTLTDALNTIEGLRGVTFRWDPTQFKDRTVPAGQQIGFIAQETQKVLPEVITTDNRGYLAVQYSNVVPVLVEAIKELQTQIDVKDAAIEKLRTDADVAVRDLQTRLATVEDFLNRLAANNSGNLNLGRWRQVAPGWYQEY